MMDRPIIPDSKPPFLAIHMWRTRVQRRVRSALSAATAARSRWNAASSDGLKAATSLVNKLLQIRQIPGMDLGVIADMPELRRRAQQKLWRQVEGERLKLQQCLNDMVSAVSSLPTSRMSIATERGVKRLALQAGITPTCVCAAALFQARGDSDDGCSVDERSGCCDENNNARDDNSDSSSESEARRQQEVAAEQQQQDPFTRLHTRETSTLDSEIPRPSSQTAASRHSHATEELDSMLRSDSTAVEGVKCTALGGGASESAGDCLQPRRGGSGRSAVQDPTAVDSLARDAPPCPLCESRRVASLLTGRLPNGGCVSGEALSLIDLTAVDAALEDPATVIGLMRENSLYEDAVVYVSLPMMAFEMWLGEVYGMMAAELAVKARIVSGIMDAIAIDGRKLGAESGCCSVPNKPHHVTGEKNDQPETSQNTLQVYLVAWLAEVHIRKAVLNSILASWEEEVKAGIR